MKIVIIDGQGGKMGKSVIEQLKKRFPSLETYAIGTNSIATSAMLKAGATYGATGENPAIVNAQDADIIIGRGSRLLLLYILYKFFQPFLWYI